MSANESKRLERSVDIESSECGPMSSSVTTMQSFVLPASRTLQVPFQVTQIEVHDVPLLTQQVSVHSHYFVNGWSSQPTIPDREVGGTPAAKARKRTRIQPPHDVVKLSERLFYLLQPDLETLLAGCSLSFLMNHFLFN